MKRIFTEGKRCFLHLIVSTCAVLFFATGTAVSANAGTEKQVTTEAELYAALADESVDTIVVNDTISLMGEENAGPWIIERPVTIQGGALSLRYTGIVLGADVTFKDIQLDFPSAESNGIAANGHTLVLDGVTRSDSVKWDIHVFGGGMTGYSYTGLPVGGEDARIVIKGYCRLGDVFAGNLQHPASEAVVYSGNTRISIDSSVSGTIGTVYGCGGWESMGDGTGNLVTADGDCAVTGQVLIGLYGSKVKKVDGRTGTETGAEVIFDGNQYLSTPTLQNISNISVVTGKLQPASGSSFLGSSIGFQVDAEAQLYLDQFDDVLTISDFSGNGELVLGQEQSLIIEGMVTGSTKVYVGGIQIGGASEKAPLEDHSYIIAKEVSEHAFVFQDYAGMTTMTPVFVSDGDQGGCWRVSSDYVDIIKVRSVDMDDVTVDLDDDSARTIRMPMVIEYTDDTTFPYLDYVRVDILVNGTAAAVSGDSDWGYTYAGDGISMYMAEDTLIITDETETGLPEAGSYRITVKIPAEYTENQSEEMTVEAELLIKKAGAEVPEVTPTVTAAPDPIPTVTVEPEPTPIVTAAPEPIPTVTEVPKPTPTVTLTPESTPTVTPKPIPTVTVPPKPTSPEDGLTFKDVKKGDFYYDAVVWALKNNVTNGYNRDTFGTLDNCTRGQIVTFLWRAAGFPSVQNQTCTFGDVAKDAYYYEAVLWAVSENITTGYNAATFGPDDQCTRGQIVTFLYRAQDGTSEINTKCDFTDMNKNDYYYNAVLWAVENKITTGISKTKFAPNYICNRAEAVTFLYRAFQ